MTLGLASRCNWLKGDRVLVFLNGIPYIQGLPSTVVHTTQAHGIREIAHTSLTSFVSKRK